MILICLLLFKPEWYFTQVLTWVKSHREFLTSKIQPLLEKAGLGYVDSVVRILFIPTVYCWKALKLTVILPTCASTIRLCTPLLFCLQAEFCRGLVILVMEKMLADIPQVLGDDHLFSHLVDEALAFDKEMTTGCGYPAGHLTCLHVLTQHEPFEKWIALEKKCEHIPCGLNQTNRKQYTVFKHASWEYCWPEQIILKVKPQQVLVPGHQTLSWCYWNTAPLIFDIVVSSCSCPGEDGCHAFIWLSLAFPV